MRLLKREKQLLTLLMLASFMIAPIFLNRNFEAASPMALPSKEVYLSSAIGEISKRQISSDIVYADRLPPNSTRRYSVNVPEKTLLILGLRTSEAKEARIEISFRGDGGKVAVAFMPFPKEAKGALYYSAGGGEVIVTLRNMEETALDYEFYVDLSESIRHIDSKNILLEGFPVAFHADLRKDDELSIDFSSRGINESFPQLRVYTLYLSQRGYLFRQYASSHSGRIKFKADLVDRYYIIIKPQANERKVYLHARIESPIWNQSWFWPAFSLGLSAAFSMWLWLKIKNFRGLQKEAKYTLISDFLSLLTLSFFSSVLGAYDSRTPVLNSLFSFATLLYALSLGSHLYAAYLRRRIPIAICPHCFRKVNVEEISFCCGERVKRTSNLLCFMPLAFGLLFLFIMYSVPIQFTDVFSLSLNVGSFGCLLGGVLSWIINRKIAKRAWIYIAIGIVSALLFPWLISFIIVFSEIFLPVVHYEIYSNISLVLRLVRVNAASPVSFGVAATFIFLAALVVYLLHKQIKMAMAYA